MVEAGQLKMNANHKFSIRHIENFFFLITMKVIRNWANQAFFIDQTKWIDGTHEDWKIEYCQLAKVSIEFETKLISNCYKTENYKSIK